MAMDGLDAPVVGRRFVSAAKEVEGVTMVTQLQPLQMMKTLTVCLIFNV